MKDDISSLLIKPQDVVDSIVRTESCVMDNPQLRTSLETNAVKRVVDFTWYESAKELEKGYKHVITNS